MIFIFFSFARNISMTYYLLLRFLCDSYGVYLYVKGFLQEQNGKRQRHVGEKFFFYTNNKDKHSYLVLF